MDGVKELFLRRLEQIWTPEKLHKFVSEQVNWMYEDLESPKDMKAAFLKDFHDEFVNIANAMAGPFEAYQKILMCDARPILHISGPVNLKDLMNHGKICKLPEGCDVEWVEKDAIEAIMNTPEYKEAMKEIEKEIFNNARIEFEQRNRAPEREDSPGTY